MSGMRIAADGILLHVMNIRFVTVRLYDDEPSG